MALQVEPLSGSGEPAAPQRTNYFMVFWVQEGSGVFFAESGAHPFRANSLLFLAPYQPYYFRAAATLSGLTMKFHANFLCIETYHEEVGCNGVLFNDTFGVPCVGLEEQQARECGQVLGEMGRELREGGLAHSEVLLSYLKIFLVRATRWKLQQQEGRCGIAAPLPAVVGELQRLIEEHFRVQHAPAAYAEMLGMAPKSLARVARVHLHRTLTELIKERIVRQAKWELLHTRKPVKEVAGDLGFADVFYFSRIFKQATGCSPTFFREFETEIRGGRNLSMR